ncbi:unnamed protein product [Ectocarpus sp. 12 AP-2014]
MYDANICTQRDRSVHFKRGWRAAYYQTVTAVLEDVRVFRVARRIRGSSPQGVHVIEIYQECGRLFFHTYDPESCVSNFCAIEESKVSHLLAPALDQPPEFGPSTVPCDRQDMLTRLATLLSFEAAPLNDTVCWGVPHLVCQRRLRCLLRDTRLISGYRAQVTVYEEAKGELRYCLYLADHAARIQLKVDARLLEKVLQDSSDVTGERQAITSEDTGRLLVPVTDRLVISPSRAAVVTMGAGCGGKKMTSSSQGFVLKIRCKGGPGRRVLRAVCVISGAPHVVSVWELGGGGGLRLTAYDPAKSMTYGIGISKAERAFFGCNGDDRKYWIKHLGRRLSLRRGTETTIMEGAEATGEPLPGRRTMLLDKTIFSTACRVAAGRIDARLFRMRAELADAGQSLALDLYQADTSKQCRILLTEEDLAALGLEPCTACPNGSQTDDSRTSDTSPTRCSGQRGAMAGMLIGPGSRVAAVRQLTRHLCFAPDSDSVILSIDGGSRINAMEYSIVARQRRPQSTAPIALSQTRSTGSYAVGRCGFVAGFLKQRHQPCVLLHGLLSPRMRHIGKNRVLNTPRESPKRKKGKRKRDNFQKPVNEGGNPSAGLSELRDGMMVSDSITAAAARALPSHKACTQGASQCTQCPTLRLAYLEALVFRHFHLRYLISIYSMAPEQIHDLPTCAWCHHFDNHSRMSLRWILFVLSVVGLHLYAWHEMANATYLTEQFLYEKMTGKSINQRVIRW